MAMKRSGEVQDDLMATWAEMPRSPGHAFYDRLQEVLREAGFDVLVEKVCRRYYAPRMGRAVSFARAVRLRVKSECVSFLARRKSILPS
jgi:hypothetical protein